MFYDSALYKFTTDIDSDIYEIHAIACFGFGKTTIFGEIATLPLPVIARHLEFSGDYSVAS